MGLTVHYHFAAGDVPAEKAREYVEALRQWALDLPFKEVGEIVELKGVDCEHHPGNNSNPNLWLQIQSSVHIETDDRYSVDVSAVHIIGFTIWPGEGCESAEIGLALHPKAVKFRGKTVKVEQAEKGWNWGAFCKTQYASDPRYGGVKNFLRCHISLIRLLGRAQVLGILEQVNDEGGFHGNWDVAALAREVGEWNQATANLAGEIQAGLDREGKGTSVEAPITGYPNFEHLEAEGRAAKKEGKSYDPEV